MNFIPILVAAAAMLSAGRGLAAETNELPIVPTTGESIDAVSVNASDVNLYGLDSWAESFLTVPAENQSFQIKVTGASNVTYRVTSGNSCTVSDTGLIEMKYNTWYWYGYIGYSSPRADQEPTRITKDLIQGDSVVTVTADGTTYTVNVHVGEYSSVYADQKIDEYIAAHVTSGMTDYEKVTEACKMAASYNYSASYSSATGMIVSGGGDCWASTDLIIKFCTKLGMEAWSRNGNRDSGAGSGHMNAMVLGSDGVYYEAEAGYSGTAPRSYSVRKRDSLFSYRTDYTYGGITVYQYDGNENPETLVVPETIGGKTVTGIGESFISLERDIKTVQLPDTVKHIDKSAFNTCYDLETVNLPKSLETMGNFVFTNSTKLSNVIIPAGSNYAYKDGGIYDKDYTTLYYLVNASEVKLPDTLTGFGEYAFYYNKNITTVTVPAGVTTLPLGTFANCSELSEVNLPDGLETIGEGTFASCPKLKEIHIPASVTSIDGNAFYNKPSDLTIYGKTGSTAETFANENSITFVPDDNIEAAEVTLGATSFTYNGSAKSPSVKVVLYGKTLKKGTDYTVAYKNNVNVGTASVVITGKGYYTGTVTKTYTIKAGATDISKATATLGATSFVYTGTAKNPSVKLAYSGTTLKKGTDYTIEYVNNVNAGTASVIITGKGKFTGTKTVNYTIKRRNVANFTITLSKTSFAYTGTAKNPSVTVKYGSYTLKKGTDYKVTYTNNVEKGTATVTITGKGNFGGTLSANYTIK